MYELEYLYDVNVVTQTWRSVKSHRHGPTKFACSIANAIYKKQWADINSFGSLNWNDGRFSNELHSFLHGSFVIGIAQFSMNAPAPARPQKTVRDNTMVLTCFRCDNREKVILAHV